MTKSPKNLAKLTARTPASQGCSATSMARANAARTVLSCALLCLLHAAAAVPGGNCKVHHADCDPPPPPPPIPPPPPPDAVPPGGYEKMSRMKTFTTQGLQLSALETRRATDFQKVAAGNIKTRLSREYTWLEFDVVCWGSLATEDEDRFWALGNDTRCNVQEPPAYCANYGGSATVLNVPKFLYETTYDLVNAMVMYRPHWMPPRDPAEVRFWQESLRDCLTDATVEGKVWEWPATVLTVGAPPSSGPTEKGPTLGPLLECMAKEFFNEGRHHKGLLAFYQQQPRPNRPVSKAVGAGGIFLADEHLPRFNRWGSTFDTYMMPPYGYLF